MRVPILCLALENYIQQCLITYYNETFLRLEKRRK